MSENSPELILFIACSTIRIGTFSIAFAQGHTISSPTVSIVSFLAGA